jgi:hypothetical protein
MAYQFIRPCAFVPDAESFTEEFHTLSLPRAWRDELLKLYRTGKYNPDRIRQVPIKGFGRLLRAVAPELVVMNRDLTIDDADPTLYATTPFPEGVLGALVNTWALDLQPAPEMYVPVRETLEWLRPEELTWQHDRVDLLERTLSQGGTAMPADRLYRLLPEMLARRIAQLPPYEFEGVRLPFRQAPATTRGAAELVSWPPQEHRTMRGKRVWHFSIYLRVSLQTEPFDPMPRIHLETGVRRWETNRKVFLPQGDTVSVYLAADAPWLLDAPQPHTQRFAEGKLCWDRSLKGVGWSAGGPERMLRRLTFNRDFPDPEILRKEPGQWLEGTGGVTAAVVHSTMMNAHGVGPGLMPRDRAPLTEWAAQALTPEFRRVPDLRRSTLDKNPLNGPKRGKNKPAETDDGSSDTARARRSQLARLLDEPVLIVDMLIQTTAVREAIVAAAMDDLGLDATPENSVVNGDCETHAWQTAELELQLRLRPLGAIGAGLTIDDHTPVNRDQWDAAVAARRLVVSDHMAGLGPGARLALAEIGRPTDFAGSAADPKLALRLGFADAQMVSQFLQRPLAPGDDGYDEESDDVAHRAKAAWQDGLRQIGLSTLPAHSLGDDIPEDLQYLAFWAIRKNRSGQTRHAHFLPVAVLMRPELPGALASMPGLGKWIPYADLLQQIGQDGTRQESWTRQARKAAVAQFIRWMLNSLCSRPTLLLTHAQNGRESWPWLTNSASEKDKVKLGETDPQRLRLFGPGLRHVRVRDSASGETAQWFAPNEKTGIHGLSEGVWVPAGAGLSNRVFGSITAKPDTAKNSAVSASKLVPGANGRTAAGQNAWNPVLLELAVLGLQDGDVPETWAALTHQLRITADHRNPLKLPLPLHLASLIAEYVLHTEKDQPS